MYKLGIDLGGTNIAAGVVDENYNIIGRGSRKTNMPRPAEEIVKDIAAAAVDAIADAGLKKEDIECMGIGTPGSIDPDNGIVIFSNNSAADTSGCSAVLEDSSYTASALKK